MVLSPNEYAVVYMGSLDESNALQALLPGSGDLKPGGRLVSAPFDGVHWIPLSAKPLVYAPVQSKDSKANRVGALSG